MRVEQAGVPLRLFVVKPVEERERELRHPVVDAIRARPEHLPDASTLTRPLHRWRPADVAPFMPALKRVAGRRPGGLARATATAAAQAIRDRRTPLSGPRKIYVKELLQAIALADRVIAAPDVRHLHAHFAHGTTTIAWHAARIAGLPFSFTGHARDIYAEQLNPKGWLRRKLLAARFVVTCTAANVRHLEAIAPGGGRAPRLPRAQRRLRPYARRAGARGRRNGTAARPRRRPPGGQEGLRRPRRRLRRPAPPRRRVRGRDRRAGGQALGAVRERIAATASRSTSCSRGRWPRTNCCASTAARARCACPAACSPTTATGSRTCSSRRWRPARRSIASAVSGIPELVEHEVNGLLVAPEDPEALADTLLRLHGDPALSRALARAARETVARRFDGATAGEPARRAVPGGGRA